MFEEECNIPSAMQVVQGKINRRDGSHTGDETGGTEW